MGDHHGGDRPRSREVFTGINPAATMVEVRRLVNRDHLVEIEVEAVVEDERPDRS